MIRLMLTLAPIVCVIAGIALSEIMNQAGDSIRQAFIETGSQAAVKPDDSEFQRIEKPDDPKKTTSVKKQKDQKAESLIAEKEKVVKK